MQIAIGSDEERFKQKKKNKTSEANTVKTLGVYDENTVIYPDVAVSVAQYVADGSCGRGILIYGTRYRMTITANKVNGIHCGLP